MTARSNKVLTDRTDLTGLSSRRRAPISSGRAAYSGGWDRRMARLSNEFQSVATAACGAAGC